MLGKVDETLQVPPTQLQHSFKTVVMCLSDMLVKILHAQIAKSQFRACAAQCFLAILEASGFS